MASSLSPNPSSPELEELKKSIYDHEDYSSMISILSSKKKWLTKEKKAKTSLLLDNTDEKSKSNRNVILPLKSLMWFLIAKLCCSKCCKWIVAADGEKSPKELEVFGIATRLHFNVDAVPLPVFARMSCLNCRKKFNR